MDEQELSELSAKVEALFDFQVRVNQLRDQYEKTSKNVSPNSVHQRAYHGAAVACDRISDMLDKEMDKLLTKANKDTR